MIRLGHKWLRAKYKCGDDSIPIVNVLKLLQIFGEGFAIIGIISLNNIAWRLSDREKASF